MTRQYPQVASTHLESVVQSSASATLAIDHVARIEAGVSNMFQAAHERKPNLGGGRRLGDEVDLTTNQPNSMDLDGNETAPQISCILQSPILTGISYASNNREKTSHHKGENQMRRLGVPIESDFQYICAASARAMRLFLQIRDKHCSETEEIESLQRAIDKQVTTKLDLLKRREALTDSESHDDGEQMTQLVSLQEGEYNCERVIAQLTVNLTQRQQSCEITRVQRQQAESNANSLYKRSVTIIQSFRDPFQHLNTSSLPIIITPICGPKRNRLMWNVVARQYAGGGNWGQVLPQRRQMGSAPTRKSVAVVRKTLLATRLSHAATINAHLTFPVYCLRFDRSGRYFVTGADDCLVKLFILGAGSSTVPLRSQIGGKTVAFNYGANNRSAVLVSTMRGHAGVICDIDVSADNAFLATASDDGDVRIWGLRDGCPIAILRGHKGGANMVSWSVTTPYRLVTTGMDGLSRIWDVREAALKRYASQIGSRFDYRLPLTHEEKKATFGENDKEMQIDLPDTAETQLANGIVHSNLAVPPALPVFDPAASVALPAGVGNSVMHLAQGPVDVDEEEEVAHNGAPGSFVLNDNLDEGVKIVAKLQHGEKADTHAVGPGTRSRRKDVKVICVARCPFGGHFATGSDDGICRVWLDEDDARLTNLDSRFARMCDGKVDQLQNSNRLPPSDAPSTKNLLATLSGHITSITDLRYSHAGDRILTASQKDGNARIWSWKVKHSLHAAGTLVGFSEMKQIVLKLSKLSADHQSSIPPRRRGGGSANIAGSAITCDVAVWTADDSKVVTSQCCPTKSSGVDIVPGSQAILIWDSWTGSCIMGISSAHEMQCPVVVPHPVDPGIICTAGADGIARVWDLEAGNCIFSHENKVIFGPVAQSNERGKKSGFLDGSFDHDGSTLILTDDNGRITVFNTQNCDEQNPTPAWTREQYFGNDYYELIYDSNGYCIERGSEQPPHLAPRSARCTHSGATWGDEVSEIFRYLKGPIPLLETDTRTQRMLIRSKCGTLPQRAQSSLECDKRTVMIMGAFDPFRTLVIKGSTGEIHSIEPVEIGLAALPSDNRIRRNSINANVNGLNVQQRSIAPNSNRALSSNYRWRDFEDLEREERSNTVADEVDSDDEEFVLHPTHRDNNIDHDDVDDDLSGGNSLESDHSGSFEYGSTPENRIARARSQRRQRREQTRADEFEVREQHPRAAPARASSRARSRLPEPDSDDDSNTEFVSTNNNPSGPFIRDYTESDHLFRLPDSGYRVKRKWLRRIESSSSYNGTKNYTPQVGDSVVYIARAHFETIRKFPTLKAPWIDWPPGARWPTIRCKIKHIRYRFPCESAYRSRNVESKCESIVAILTLEITGIPELSHDREFPWPKATFVSRQTRSAAHKFEVSMFESDLQEFIIPENLFCWRLESLEGAVRANNSEFVGIVVSCYFVSDQSDSEEDATMVTYGAKLVGLDAEACSDTNMNLRDSGFQTLKIEWDDGGSEYVCPWEVSLRDAIDEVPKSPRLSHNEKRIVRAALDKAERTPTVRDFFMSSVNETRYSDYKSRVEIPIDFSFIEQRLASDYYATVASILSDVQLVRDNCIKYNSEGADLSIAIQGVIGAFESDLSTELGPELIALADDRQAPSSSHIRSITGLNGSPSSRHTRSLRLSGEPRSSLELISSPSVTVPNSDESRTNSRTLRIRLPLSSRNQTPELGRATRRRIPEGMSNVENHTRDRVSNLEQGTTGSDEIVFVTGFRGSQLAEASHLDQVQDRKDASSRMSIRSSRRRQDGQTRGYGTRSSSRDSSHILRLYKDLESSEEPEDELDEDSSECEEDFAPACKRVQSARVSSRSKTLRGRRLHRDPDDAQSEESEKEEEEEEDEEEEEESVASPSLENVSAINHVQSARNSSRGKSLRRQREESTSDEDSGQDEESDALSAMESENNESDDDNDLVSRKRKLTHPLRTAAKKYKATSPKGNTPSPRRRSSRTRSAVSKNSEDPYPSHDDGKPEDEPPKRSQPRRAVAMRSQPTRCKFVIFMGVVKCICVETLVSNPFRHQPCPLNQEAN